MADVTLKRMFDSYVARWNLVPDGQAIHTHSSDLLPVRFDGLPAMLKVPGGDEERLGGRLMLWWDGDGAARVYRHDVHSGALLLERPAGKVSLEQMVRDGRDDDSSRILCAVAEKLRGPRAVPLPDLVPLEVWFQALPRMAEKYGGVLREAAVTARDLLDEPREVTVLHGDLHHGNVLDGESRGWLVIDPKGLRGERGFEYANIFNNPDLDVARRPGRLARQVKVVSDAAKLDAARLLRWILAYSGLSASWWLEDGREQEAVPVLEVARLASAELAVLGG